MEVISKGINDVYKLLGKQNVDNGKYHCSQFTVEYKYNKYFVLLNTLTRRIIRLDKERFRSYNSILEALNDIDFEKDNQDADLVELKKRLIEDWFYLSDDINDLDFYNQIDNIFKPKDEKCFLGYRNFIIFTTTVCNANCYYCFEKGIEKGNMTEETANNVADYIIKERNVNEKVILAWFGGEPLCNTKVIDIIADRLKKEGIEYISYITTNGSIFDDVLLNRAKSEWNLKHAQVTLDGTRDIYNSIKDYNNKEKYNFDNVIENIFKLSDNNIDVTVRMNTNENNIDDITSLIDMFEQRALNKNIFLDFHDITNSINNMNVSPKSDDYWRKFINLKYRCIKLTFKTGEEFHENLLKLYSKYRGGFCQSSAIRIYTNGDIYACQHTLECSPIGNVRDGIIDVKSYNLYRKRVIDEKCLKCMFLPLCPTLKMCPTRHSNCIDVAKKIHEYNIEFLLCYDKGSGKIYKSDGVVEYKLLGNYVLSIEGKNDKNIVIKLNNSAYLIWQTIKNGSTIDEIVKNIELKYNVSDAKCNEFVKKTISKFEKSGYIYFK